MIPLHVGMELNLNDTNFQLKIRLSSRYSGFVMSHTSPFYYSFLHFKQKVYGLFTGAALTGRYLFLTKSDPPCYSLPRAADHWHHMQARGPYPPTCCCRLEGRCPSTHSAPEPCLSSSLPVVSSRHLYCAMLRHIHIDIQTDKTDEHFRLLTCDPGRWFVGYLMACSVLRLSSFR